MCLKGPAERPNTQVQNITKQVCWKNFTALAEKPDIF